MSKVTVLDDPTFDHDIYMNHILNHKGYRFFQDRCSPWTYKVNHLTQKNIYPTIGF